VLNSSLRILVADDHEIIRGGLRTLLQSHEGWTVCGEATDGREAVAKARKLKPDIAVMDLTMPELNGLEATRQIRKSVPRCRVVILTMHESEQLMREVLVAGARGYVLKSDAGNTIVHAIEAVRRGKSYFTSKLSDILLKSYLTPKAKEARGTNAWNGPTPREREIVQLIAEGKSTKDIAGVLGISEKTVETHRSNLMRKLGVHSVSEIVRYAIRNCIVKA